MITDDFFLKYLLASLPDDYPLAEVPLSLNMREVHRRELIFQQSKFLDIAHEYLQVQPSLAYLAAIKHTKLLSFHPTDTGTFREIADKDFFTKVQSHCQSLMSEAQKSLDTNTKEELEFLVELQNLNPKITKTIDFLNQAISKGYSSFNLSYFKATYPKVPTPPMLPTKMGFYTAMQGIGCLTFILLLLLIPFTKYALFMLLLLTALIWLFDLYLKSDSAYIQYQNKLKIYNQETFEYERKRLELQTIIDSYKYFREQFYSNAQPIISILKLDENSITMDLYKAVQVFENLLNKRKEIEDKYIQ